MKRYVYRLVAAFFCLAFLGSVHAQSLKTFDREVCSGASIYTDGGLYQKQVGDCEILSIKAGGTGPELKDEERLNPNVTTTYHISYRESGNIYSATATITINTPPTLRVAVTSPSPLPASICPNTNVTLTVAQHSESNVYWTNSLNQDVSESGLLKTYTLTESCRITAQSYNSCGFIDTSFYFFVSSTPDLSNVKLELNTDLNGTFCADCGFFPKTSDILKGTQPNVNIQNSSVTWGDGSVTEETIRQTDLVKQVTVHAVVSQTSACGTATRNIDSTITLRVQKGVDCKPQIKNTATLKPCQDREVQLENNYKGLCTINDKPTLTSVSPVSKITVNEFSPFIYQDDRVVLYRWNARWENYAKNDAAQTLRVTATYNISCPYSTVQPVKTNIPFTQDVNVQIDTSYLSFKYQYCPNDNAELEIKGPQDIVTIDKVELIKPTGGFSTLFTETGESKPYNRTYRTVSAVTDANIAQYIPLTLKVSFSVDNGTCHFTLEEKKEFIRIEDKGSCKTDLEMVSTGYCIGEPRTLRLKDVPTGSQVDSIVIDPHPVFNFKMYDRDPANPGQRMFVPYYAGAPDIKSQSADIVVTAYYRSSGNSAQVSLTKEIKLDVNACAPYFTQTIPVNNETQPCPLCPGAMYQATLEFKNTTTDTGKTKIYFEPTASNRVVEGIQWRKQGNGAWRYSIKQALFEDIAYKVAVRYNAGDSIYRIDSLALADETGREIIPTNRGETGMGETVTSKFVGMSNRCSLVSYAEEDSVCSGDLVDLYVYSENLFEDFERIEWADPNVKPASGTGLESNWTYTYVNGSGTTRNYNIKRFHYQVNAQGSGLYAFKVYSKIRDTSIVRYDTIHVAVAKNPRIFIQDTVYACDGQSIDLIDYVDFSVVKTIDDPAGLQVSIATDGEPRTASGTLRYQCSSGSTVTDRIVIRAEKPVYNAINPDEAYCPGEPIALKAGTNGRITWVKRRVLEGGGLSQPDTLLVNGAANAIVNDVMGTEDILYTVTAQTTCPTPAITVQFKAESKPVPEVAVIDNSACRPEPLVLQTEPFDPTEVDSAKDVKWYVNGNPYTLPTVQPADNVTVRCEVTGKNGCVGSDEMVMHSYNAPDLKIVSDVPQGRLLCVDKGQQVTFTAQGADAYDWFVVSQQSSVSVADVYTLKVNQDDTVYVSGTENVLGCKSIDTVWVYLKPMAQVQDDTIACWGEDFEIPVVPEAGVSYAWYDQEKNYLCHCSYLGISDYVAADTGIYTVEFIRNGCTETRSVRLKMYPVPEFDFTETEFCQGDNLKLDVNTGLSADWLRQSRFIWKKDGQELQDKVGNSAYTGGKLALSDAGDYELEIQVDRCVNKDTVNVRVDARSHPAFPVDSFYCEGSDFVTDAENQGEGASYEWYSENRPYMGSSPMTRLELGGLEMADSAYLKLTVYRGACVDDTSIFIHVRSMPRPELQAVGAKQDEKGIFYCAGTPLRIDVPDARGNDLMEWYHDGERIEGADLGSYGVASASLEDGGKYMFKVERNGCYGEASLYVDVRPLPVPLVGDTFMCSGHVFAIDASNEDYPGATFRWSPLGTSGAVAEINTGGQYSVVMIYEGCEGGKSFVVEERPSPSIGFPSDTVMCQRDSILLTGPEAMETYRWQDGTSGQTYMVNTEGLYSLYVELMGCSDYNEVFVHEDFCSNLYFPSAFTPNGDGSNDFFGPITTAIDEQVVYSLYIYNRNGEKVFESHSMTEVWDGTYKGSQCPAGVYVYRCKAHAKQNGRNLSADGTVTLIR